MLKTSESKFVIAIDPHKEHCDYVMFLDNKIISVAKERTNQGILKQKHKLCNDNSVAIIEGGWLGKNPKQNIEQCILIGRLYQSFWSIGYRVILVPSWGPSCWQRMILASGNGYKVPSRKDTAKMAVIRAKADHPNQDWDEHTASAYCMAQWYFSLLKVGHNFG